MRFSYHTEQWLPRPAEQIFDFFADPENLPLLMPPWQSARIDEASIVPPPVSLSTRSPAAGAAGVGTLLALSLRPFPYSPLRLRWESEISEFAWDHHFCDRQLNGPFAYWNHCHYIRPALRNGTNGTLVSDDVEYELPLGILGRIAHGIFVRSQIERTFTHRQRQLERIFAPVTVHSFPR